MKVDVYIDVLCPWCFIGKRRLETALTELNPRDRHRVRIRWRSYELGPHLGRTPGMTAAAEMAQPGWWGDQAPARVARIHALGAAEDLHLNLHRARPVNTFDAHRLLQLATTRGRADAVVEGLFHAYHTDGLNIADPDVLLSQGLQAGLDGIEVRATLAGRAYSAEVRADERRGAARGVTGVPTIVIDGGPPLPGIQPSAELQRLLTDALHTRAPPRHDPRADRARPSDELDAHGPRHRK